MRVGYYVNNEYTDEALIAEPPAKPIIEKVRRNILAEKPRVTRFAIKWYFPYLQLSIPLLTSQYRDSEASAPPEFPPDQPEADALEADGETYGAEEEEEEATEEVEAEAAEGEDAEMAGAEDTAAAKKDDDAASDAGSEDLEAESSGDEEDEEEEEEEGDGDEDMDMGEDGEKAPEANGNVHAEQPLQQSADVMVH